LKSRSYYPSEFGDIRRRNLNPLTHAEKEDLKKMPTLDVWQDEQPAEGWSRKRKLDLDEQQASISLEEEPQESKLAQHGKLSLVRRLKLQ
jgi:hypothetical protein